MLTGKHNIRLALKAMVAPVRLTPDHQKQAGLRTARPANPENPLSRGAMRGSVPYARPEVRCAHVPARKNA